MPSRALGPASENCVFVFLHQTREETIVDYKRVVTEFLPQNFNHPMFLFLRPDGTEIDESLRHEHQYVSGSQIAKILKDSVWPVMGKGLDPKAYEKARDAVAAAAALVDAKDEVSADDVAKARRSLAAATKLKTPCGIRDRAQLMVEDLDRRAALGDAWARSGAETANVGARIGAGDYVRLHRSADLDDMREPIERAIVDQFEFTEARHEFVILDETTVHHYLEATFRCGIKKAEGLTVEVSILTTTGDVLDSYGRIVSVDRSSRIMLAATITPRALKGNLIQAVRFRLFLDDLLLAEIIEEGGPKAWPATTIPKTGPDFYDAVDAWHVSGDLVIEGVRVGRVG